MAGPRAGMLGPGCSGGLGDAAAAKRRLHPGRGSSVPSAPHRKAAASAPAWRAPSRGEEKLIALGWYLDEVGMLRSPEDGAPCSRDYMLEVLGRPPWSLECALLAGDAGEGPSCRVYWSAGVHQHPGCMLVLVPSIECRAGVWDCSLGATGGLDSGSVLELLSLACARGMAQVVLDVPREAELKDGALSARSCVGAWRTFVETSAAAEVYVVAHPSGGASLVECLAASSAATLARVRGIAFVNPVPCIGGEDCLQLGATELPDEVKEALKERVVQWQADVAPLDEERAPGGGLRGARCASAGALEHAGTKSAACRRIFGHFARRSGCGLAAPEEAAREAPEAPPAPSRGIGGAAEEAAAARRSGAAAAGGARAAGGRRQGVKVEREYPLPHGAKLFICVGNIVNFGGDAVVNAANTRCLGGGGVDNAISIAGGPALAAARKALPVVPGTAATRCPTGEARITIGGNLHARWCIHAVGPNYIRGKPLQEDDKLLMAAYRSALACAKEKGLASIAFPLLSSGVFKGPQTMERVCECGVLGVQSGAYEGLREVFMVAFSPGDAKALQSACEKASTLGAGAGAA